LRIDNKEQISTFSLDGISYHLDKLLPALEVAIQEGKRIHMEIFIKEKKEVDIILVSPDFSEISSFIRSFPKTKLYRSLHYFIPRFIYVP
jgi:hypothetical protein